MHSRTDAYRWHHYGAGTIDHPTKRAIKLAFDPNDESWRRAVLKRGQDLLKEIRGQTGEFPILGAEK